MLLLNINPVGAMVIVIIIALIVLFILLPYFRKRNNILFAVEEKQVPVGETLDPLEKISRATAIPVSEIKIILGHPLLGICSVNTADEAEDAYYRSKSGSDEKHLALKKWIELAVNLDQLQNAIDEAYDKNYASLEKLGNEKWDILSMERFTPTTTEQDLISIVEDSTYDSPQVLRAVKELYQLYVQSCE